MQAYPPLRPMHISELPADHEGEEIRRQVVRKGMSGVMLPCQAQPGEQGPAQQVPKTSYQCSKKLSLTLGVLQTPSHDLLDYLPELVIVDPAVVLARALDRTNDIADLLLGSLHITLDEPALHERGPRMLSEYQTPLVSHLVRVDALIGHGTVEDRSDMNA